MNCLHCSCANLSANQEQCCGAAQLTVAPCGHLCPSVPIPQSAGRTGVPRQCWELPELLFSLQNDL